MHFFKFVNSTQFLQRGVTVNKEPLLTHAWENWFEKTKNMHTTSGYYLTASLKQNKKTKLFYLGFQCFKRSCVSLSDAVVLDIL